MLSARFDARVVHLVLMVMGAGTVFAQNFPNNKPIRFVTTEPGGSNDVEMRIIAQGISESLGQPVIVDNRPNGVIPPDIVAKAPPDGHTLLAYNNGFWLGPLMQKTPYDPIRDFLPVALVSISPSVFVVHPSVAANSIKDLIALAKAKPGTLNYATTGTGSSSFLAGELFKAMAGVDIVNIPYKGGAAALIDVAANRVQLMIPPATPAIPHVKAGRLKALAITSAEPSVLVPGVPTMAASGLPGYELVSRLGIFAPARTPATVINRLNQEIVRLLKTTDVKERFVVVGVEALGSTPEQFGVMVKSEIAVISKVIKNAGMQPEAR